MSIVITAWNVRQGGGGRALRIVNALVALETDIAMLSEWRANSGNRLADRLRDAGFEHQVARPDPEGRYAAVLTASRTPIEVAELGYDDPLDGHRFNHVHIENHGWSVATAYIPGYERTTERKRRFWDFIVNTWAPSVAATRTLLCGDLNTGLHYRDELGATLQSHDQQMALEMAGWRDAWVERNRSERPPGTWFSPQAGKPFRLDHALLSPAAPRARSVEYPTAINGVPVLGPGGLSDHLPVVLRL